MAKDAKAQARALPWDAFTLTTKDITVATKTAQGIGFAFTSDGNIIVMCDEQGMYKPSELTGCLKQSGNFSDYDTARVIAAVVTSDMDIVPLEDIKDAFESATTRLNFPAAALEELKEVDWSAAYTELEPFIKAIQALNATKPLSM